MADEISDEKKIRNYIRMTQHTTTTHHAIFPNNKYNLTLAGPKKSIKKKRKRKLDKIRTTNLYRCTDGITANKNYPVY